MTKEEKRLKFKSGTVKKGVRESFLQPQKTIGIHSMNQLLHIYIPSRTSSSLL